MSEAPEAWKKYLAWLRLYVAVSPESAEDAWKVAQCFDAVKPEDQIPGHFYRYAHDNSLIAFKADGSGQWYPSGQMPEGFDPARVVELPDFLVKNLRDELVSLLNAALENAPDHQQIAEKIEIINNLHTADRAARLLASLLTTLRQVAESGAAKVEFLEQAANQMVGKELLAGKVTGRDAAGVVFMSAMAKQLAQMDEKTCLAIVTRMLNIAAGSTEELGAAMLKECIRLNLKEQIAGALSALQSTGNEIVKQAQAGTYPEGHPEYCLEIYYGGILQAIPYLLSAQDNYTFLKNAPGLTEDEREIFAQREEATEERAVRLRYALLFATGDLDQSRLRSMQGYTRFLLKQDRKKADEFVRQTIEYQFFYPRNFVSVLTGESA